MKILKVSKIIQCYQNCSSCSKTSYHIIFSIMQTALVIYLHLGSKPGNWVGRWSEAQAFRRGTLDRAPALLACPVAMTQRGYPGLIEVESVEPQSPSTRGPPIAAAAAATAPMVLACRQQVLAAVSKVARCRRGVPPLSQGPWRRNWPPM